ncbi:MAG TPA: Ku protein [Acidimicrobiales bacterium]|jgi:DNA end-binding protein Ku|nr:Ku protein [Acidimicrobiales bacterium]
MPRAIWNGSISFGLVNIPIKLYNAVSRKNVSFHQIDANTGARIKMQRVSSKTGEEVPFEQIVKGYELSPDRYVLVEPQELDALDPESSHSIDIEEFVDLAEIDPIFFDAAYYVAPGKAAEKPYALLAKAMEEQGKVALARFVMRTKQYLAAVRAKEGMLLLSTMVYPDEVVPPEQLPELESVDSVKVNDKEVAMAAQLIDSLSADFEPERFKDTYREQVLDLIERKAAGEEIVIEDAPAPDATSVVDLMAALEASVAEAREARKRHPTAVAADGEDEDDEDESPKASASASSSKAKKATKKRAAPAKRAKKSA